MSNVWFLRSRRALLLACVAAALLGLPAAALAEDPIDDYYSAEVQQGGWLQRIGWSWDAIQGAHYSDVAYPTIAIVDSGIDGAHPEFAEDGVVDPASADCRTRPPAAVERRPRARGRPGQGPRDDGRRARGGAGQRGRHRRRLAVLDGARDAHRPRGAGRPGLRPQLSGTADGPRRDRSARGQPLAQRPAVASRPPCAGASPSSCAAARCSWRRRGTGARQRRARGLPGPPAARARHRRHGAAGPAARRGARPARTGRQPCSRRRPAAAGSTIGASHDLVRDGRRVGRGRGRVGCAPGGLGADGAAGRLAPARDGHAARRAGRATAGFGTIQVDDALRSPRRRSRRRRIRAERLGHRRQRSRVAAAPRLHQGLHAPRPGRPDGRSRGLVGRPRRRPAAWSVASSAAPASTPAWCRGRGASTTSASPRRARPPRTRSRCAPASAASPGADEVVRGRATPGRGRARSARGGRARTTS